MNEKDKEAFESWFNENSYDYYGYEKNNQEIGWESACLYKDREYSNLMDAMTKTSQNNAKLQAENSKLIEVVKFYADRWERGELDGELLVRKAESFDHFTEVHYKARQVLKELGWIKC